MSIKDTAFNYLNFYGLNVVPLQTKKPLILWTAWRNKQQTKQDFNVFPWDEADGFALIGGSKNKVGLYLCAVDYDVKNLPEEIVLKGREITKHLPSTNVEGTPSGGQHWLYFCRKKYDYIKKYHEFCAVELLGDNRLIIMYPSKGYSKQNKKPITVLNDFDFLINIMEKYYIRKKYVRINVKPVATTKLIVPPCVDDFLNELKNTGELDHVQRMHVSAYLINTVGYKFAMDVLARYAKDFKEYYTSYQLQWLEKNNYKPYSCKRLIDEGLCPGKCSQFPYCFKEN